MAKKQSRSLVSAEQIEQSILIVRGHKVLLDADLAQLYGVETKALVQAMRRNIDRFPDDFMFQLSRDEWAALRSQIRTLDLRRPIGSSKSPESPSGLRSQIVTSNWGGRRTLPYVFTEQGVAMLSSVLRSQRAVQVNIEIMRAFVRLRQLLAASADLARRLDEVERHLAQHDGQFVDVIRAIRQLMEPPARPPRRRIGFHAPPDAAEVAKPTDKGNYAKRRRDKKAKRETKAGVTNDAG
jgi:ORF6N domain